MFFIYYFVLLWAYGNIHFCPISHLACKGTTKNAHMQENQRKIIIKLVFLPIDAMERTIFYPTFTGS